ncbi:ATP-dependent RecD-like DNA helicase [Streptomyces sp. RB17]|uniref:helix-hairpin-helix domain-containing protein n=1 Tax=Streptomyces sp. RB17 TaxID=2585197 RepID=UPI00130CC8D5|nr:helix-hairpin-helix domain-containing protein [Streptomyces sp. RB17]MQY38888.1 ATP-dependent RecD-like DNA helicase [Streptomyces sp. RB17]
MSTEPETTEETGPGTPDTSETQGGESASAAPRPAHGTESNGAEGDASGARGEAGTGEARVDGGDGPEGAGGADEGRGAGEAGTGTGGADGGTGAGGAESGTGAGGPASGEPASETGAATDGDGGAEGAGGADEGRGAGEAGTGTGGADGGTGAATDGDGGADGGTGDGGAGDAAQLSEAEAELAAQQVERERIERRKAEKRGPIESGTKLSGRAADLLAAVRAVESGEKPVGPVFAEPAPAPRRPAPEPVRRSQPAPAPAAVTPSTPAPEAVEGVRRVLTEGGAPEALAPQVAAALGEGADAALREDPWQLLRTGGVRPEQADGFARGLLGAACGPGDERRARAITAWLLEQAALAGHTALELPTLTAALGKQGVPDPDAAVQSTLTEGEVLAFQDAPEEPGAAAPEVAAEGEDEEERPVRVLVGLERYALAEESLADGLARLVNSLSKDTEQAWQAAVDAASGGSAELARAVAGHGLVLHTGGEAARAEPAALLGAARAAGLRAFAVCHTPDGRHRLAALPGPGPAEHGVGTVAGLLSGAEGPGRDADGALELDLLIVLDAPQLDVESAAMLVESLPDGARLVLSGDPAVLWSAGPGRVFADLLAARVCPQLSSRRPDAGPIGELVSGIGIGELNQVAAPGKEIVIVPVRDAGEAVHRTVQLVADSVPRAIGVPADQTVVITPGHGGAAGTRALNSALKERLNPGPGRFGGFDPGDRIVYSPAPGRSVPGVVVKADADGLHLSCAGAPVVVPRERVEGAVRHGWALTAHQAVGARWPAAVVVLPGDAAQALSRPWVYTAFGRAERHLSVVHGVEQALPKAVAETPAKPRTTRLQTLLRTQVPA